MLIVNSVANCWNSSIITYKTINLSSPQKPANAAYIKKIRTNSSLRSSRNSSVSNLPPKHERSSISKRRINPSDFYDKSLKWKNSVNEKLREKEMGLKVLTQRECSFRPLLENTRDYKCIKTIDSMWPIIKADKIEDRTKMRISLSKKRQQSRRKSKPRIQNPIKKYAKVDLH